MGKVFDEPQYPVVEKTPSFGQIVGNYNLKDWGTFGGLAAICYPFGYWAGSSPSPPYARIMGNLARSSAAMASVLGGLAGFMLAYQSSAGRLRGFLPNESEVAAMQR